MKNLIIGIIVGTILGFVMAFLIFPFYVESVVNNGLAINDTVSRFLLRCYPR